MAVDSETSFLGPAVFVGLSAFVLVTQGAPEVVFLDPAETMDMAAAVVPGALADAEALLVIAQVTQVVATAGTLVPRAGGALPSARVEAGFDGLARLAVPEVSVGLGAIAAPDLDVLDQLFAGWGARPVVVAPDTLPLAAPVRFLPPVGPHVRAAITGDLVRVRLEPDLAGAILARVNTGDLGLVLEHRGGWTLVQFARADGPLAGWVSAEFLAVQE